MRQHYYPRVELSAFLSRSNCPWVRIDYLQYLINIGRGYDHRYDKARITALGLAIIGRAVNEN